MARSVVSGSTTTRGELMGERAGMRACALSYRAVADARRRGGEKGAAANYSRSGQQRELWYTRVISIVVPRTR